MNVVEQIVTEMKAHPFTMLTIVALVAFATYAQTDHARASSLKEVNDKVERVLTLQLGESIRSISRQICELPEGQRKRVLSRTLDEVQREYRAITGAIYPVQSCAVQTD